MVEMQLYNEHVMSATLAVIFRKVDNTQGRNVHAGTRYIRAPLIYP